MKLENETKSVAVHSTQDYSQFKRLIGNRELTNKRIGIIKYSIETYGYISNPIIINEKMEVIDGQGRLAALQELNLPVEYRVIHGIGIEECWAMNLKPTGWSTADYVKSYAERGSVSYDMLLDLQAKYKHPLTTIAAIARLGSAGYSISKCLRSGEFILTNEEYSRANRILRYLNNFFDAQSEIKGRKESFFMGLAFAASLPNVDLERMDRVVHERANMIHPPACIKNFLADLTTVYNKGLGANSRIYFDVEFDQKERRKKKKEN